MELTKEKKRIINLSFVKKRDLLHFFIAFMLGRIFLLDTVSPFAIAYLCSYTGTKERSALKITLTASASILGILTTQYSHTALRYLLAYVLFGLIYISASTIHTKFPKHIPAVSAFFAMAVSGTIYYAQLDNLPYHMLMLLIECCISTSFSYVIHSSADLICNKNIFTDISTQSIAELTVLAIISAGGFCSISIGEISVGKAVCGLAIMIIAYTGRCAFSVTCGVGLGILFSLYSFEYNEYVGILGFCGLITGLASGLKRPGIILAFIVSTRLLSAYFGGWSDSVFSSYETIITICAFCLVPQSFLLRIKAYFTAGLVRNREFSKYIDAVNTKMKVTSRAFEGLAELSRNMLGKIPENTNDISTIYDITASRVCRSCGLKFACWDKEAFDTRDVLNKTVSVLCKEGNLTLENTPLEFKSKCIRYESFVNELNRTFFKYRANNQWQEKIEQSNKMLSMQLMGMSDIMEDFSESLNTAINFDTLDESKIMYSMEQADIRCSDVTVVKNHIDTACVTVVIHQRKTDFTKLCQRAELLISEALNRNMRIESYNCEKRKYTLKLKEAERYSVSCSYISIPKKGEVQCGDSVVHSKISGGKYAVILSDGMGCGKEASNQSVTAIELMQQFLNAGFNKNTSVEMINSALMLKNSESFATLDATVVDLFTADTEFIKAGANTTYIKTDNCIKKISSNTLPVGIIKSTKAEINEYKAKNGDIIIMISDGIHNATDDWFEQYILNMHEENPRMIAKLLADEAERQKKQDDDMTVAVLKIMENRGE